MSFSKKDTELEKVFKALANRRRLAMLRYIGHRRDATVGDIAEYMELSFKATSKHLALLVAADILEKEQRSVYMFFRLSSDMPQVARKNVRSL